MEENKYHPLSIEEVDRLREILKKITSHLPEGDAPFIWNVFNGVRDAREPQPCTCASSGSLWGKAIAHLRLWMRERGENF